MKNTLLVTQKEFRRFVSAAAIFVTLTFGPIALFGEPISDFGGSGLTIGNLAGTLVRITTSPFCITWGGVGNTCAGDSNSVYVSGATLPFPPGGTGSINDISTVPIVNFVTPVSAVGVIHFDLTGLPANGAVSAGNCSNAPLNSCTPAFSPFTFSEDVTGTQITIAFDALMMGYIGTSGVNYHSATPYRARFSINQSGTITGAGACNGRAANIANILTCQAAGGTIAGAWSATASPISNAGSLIITTTSVVSGTVGIPYSQTLTALLGTPPYFWSVIAGRLPVGLNFSGTTGQITGTPTYAEASIVTFQVTDASTPAQTATVTLTFTIM